MPKCPLLRWRDVDSARCLAPGTLMDLALLVFLILLNGAFAMAEMGLTAARKARLQVMVETGDKGAKAAMALHDDPTRWLSTVQIGITSIGLLNGIVGENAFAVNTFHPQGMDRASMAPIFTPSAMATPDNWLVEAYESATHSWVVGVQWHPERTFELSEAHLRLWQSFLAACTDRATRIQR